MSRFRLGLLLRKGSQLSHQFKLDGFLLIRLY